MMEKEGTYGPEARPLTEPAAEMGARDRANLLQRVTLVGAILGLVSVILYVVLYLQTGAWQLLADAGFVALAVLCMVPARWLARRWQFEMAGYWILLAILLAYGGGTLVWSGATVYNVAGGVLLVFLVATTIRPRRWGVWLGAAVGYLVIVFLIDWWAPLARYDITQSSILRVHVPLVTATLVLLTLWQVARVFRLGTIRTRLLIAFVVLALLPVIALGVAVAIGGLQSVRQQATRQLESVAVLKQGAISTWLDDLLIDLVLTRSAEQVLASVDIVHRESPASTIYAEAEGFLSRRLQKVLDESGRYEDLFLIDTDGHVLVSTDPARLGDTDSNQTYFREGLKSPSIQRPIYSPTDRRSFLYVSLPVVNELGEVTGVLAGQVSLDKLNEVMAQGSGLGETGQTYLVAVNHTLLTPPRTGELNVWVGSEGINDAVDHQTSGSGLYEDFSGIPVVGAYIWLPELQTALIAEQQQAEAFRSIYTILGVAAGVGLLAVGLAIVAALFITRSIATPLSELVDTATQIARGDLARTAKVERDDEVGALATAFNSMTGQLREFIGGLEQRVADRTRELEQRSAYLAAAADVGRTAASMLDAERLSQQVVDLIREQFNLYYVGLFLVDDSGEWAVLRAGTGEAGRAMLARGHRLRVGGESMIGWSVANRRARIALEAGEDAVRLATSELPDTRSEAALPLHSRGQVIGALTVQHTMSGAFDEDSIVALQTMADQVAVALENARLLSERQEALEAVQRAYGELSREAWRDLLRSGIGMAYRSDERGVTDASQIWRPEMEWALREGRTVRVDGADSDGRQSLAVPIKVRGETIGVLDTYKPSEAGSWTPEEVELVEEIVEQLDLALEGARLHQDAQRRAAHEETIRRITDRMRRPREVEAIVQSTLAELAKALGVSRAYVRLGTEAELSAACESHRERLEDRDDAAPPEGIAEPQEGAQEIAVERGAKG